MRVRDFVDRYVSPATSFAEDVLVPGCGCEIRTALDQSLTTMLLSERRAVEHPEAYRVLPEKLRRHALSPGQPAFASQWLAYADVRSRAWQCSIQELLVRLQDDWTLLVAEFNLDSHGTLEAISEPLGDFHADGRCVYKVTFSDGHSLVYKPRPVDAEYTFGAIIHWTARHGCDAGLSACHVLPRAGYGWARFVPTSFCETVAEAEQYSKHMGGFLALFSFLGGYDCIKPNVVMNRAHPVWVDTECLCAPNLVTDAMTPGLPTWMQDSVLTTHMLYLGDSMGVYFREASGLAASCFEDRSRAFAGTAVLAPRFADMVATGFHDFYTWLLGHQREWRNPDGPLDWLRTTQVRVVFRPTAFYTALVHLLHMSDPAARAEVRASIATLLRTDRGTSWPDTIVEPEMCALERGDVPYWSTLPTSLTIQESRGPVVRSIVTRSGMDYVNFLASRMSEEDLRCQLWLIRTFLSIADAM